MNKKLFYDQIDMDHETSEARKFGQAEGVICSLAGVVILAMLLTFL